MTLGRGDLDRGEAVVRVGVNATWVCVAALTALTLLTDWLPAGRRGAFLIIVVVASLAVVPLSWPALRRALVSRHGNRLLAAWAAVDVLLVAVAIAVTGDPTLAYLYVLPVVFFSSLLPTLVQVGLLLLIGASYSLAAAVGSAGPTVAELGLWGTTIVVASGLVAFLSSELRQRAVQRELAEADARHRSRLLETLTEAADGIFCLDPGEVLDRVVRAAASLGFEAVAFIEREDPVGAYRTTHHVGLPSSYVAVPHPIRHGLVGDVFRDPRTVVVDRYDGGTHGSEGFLHEHFRAVVVTPIRLRDDVPAVLVAAAYEERSIGTEEVEALELLAVHAGAALGNAHRFADQQRVTQRLQQIDRLKNRFVETASHELRTPVTIVKAALELLERHGEALEPDRRRDLITRATDHADDLIEMVERLTRFRDLDRNDDHLDVQAVEVRPVIVSAVGRADISCDTHVLTWAIAGEALVEADPSLIQLVLDELLDNACTHTPAGTHVRVRCHLEDDHAVVSVIDDGPGMPEEVRRGIGASFSRGADAFARRGLGLGLATVVRALYAHDVVLDVDVTPGGGTRVNFRLPLLAGDPGDDPEDVTHIPEIAPAGATD